jgi:glycine/D-amino acid oxidase-like deaminating enzyme
VSGSPALTRRRFLQGAALAPVVASAVVRAASSRPRIVVVGAGAFGGWTAWHLLRGGAEVTLVDAWGPGNPRASSGGESRVIRGIYGADRIYTEMVRRAFELWEELDATVQEPLYVPTGALWMMRGDDRYIRQALPIMEDLGFPVEEPSVAAARRRWPQIDFSGVERLYLEHRAGALSARLACLTVRDRLLDAGGSYRTARAEPGEMVAGTMRTLALGDGTRLEADSFVFACGPWLGETFPDVVGERVLPTRQEVYYFGPPAGSEAWGPERLPVWIDFGERVLYGLPDVHGRGFKLADDTRGEVIDPTTLDRRPSAEGLARARRFLAERFPGLAAAPLVESRVCQYENSPDGHLILDRHPEAGNVWFAGGGSGHGFKLGPAVGELLAAAVLGGPMPPERFRLARLAAAEPGGTQFDSRGDG